MFRQIELHNQNRERIVNVPDHPKLKVGNSIRLKGEDEFWKIAWVAAQTGKPRTDWHNNI